MKGVLGRLKKEEEIRPRAAKMKRIGRKKKKKKVKQEREWVEENNNLCLSH